MAVGIRCNDHATPHYPEKLALTSPTSGGCSFVLLLIFLFFISVSGQNLKNKLNKNTRYYNDNQLTTGVEATAVMPCIWNNKLQTMGDRQIIVV
jgi:hypothetical protein